MNQINTTLRCKIKNTPHKDGKLKQTESWREDEITKTNERKLKICENYLFNRDREKKAQRGDLGQN